MATVATLYPATTPPTYHRIISPTLSLPNDLSTPIPVGLIACQRDPLQRSIETVVISSQVYKPPQASEGTNGKKSAKKAVNAPSLPKGPVFEVILHDTVIFPEGGGQPTDTGELETTDGKVWAVLQCKRHGGHPVHFVQVPLDVDVGDALQILSSGSKCVSRLNDQDWNRRYDHMSMHTSQHLLSAILETSTLQLPTLSWSLTSYPSPCYVELPRGMTLEEITMIQDKANQLVFEGRNVHIEVEELNREAVKPVAKVASGRDVGRGLPEDYTGGVNRVVVIDGVDRNPCCGTHLPSIKNLQLFLLPHTDSISRSSASSIRLYFVAGPRLIHHLSQTHTFLAQAATILSASPSVVPERVGQVVEDRRRLDKRVGDLEGELATFIAQGLVNEIKAADDNHGLFKKHIHRVDDSSSPMGLLNSVAFAIGSAIEEAQLQDRKFLLVFTSTPSAQTSTNTTIVFAFGSDEKQVKSVGELLKAKGIKGGGKGPRWSGKFTGVWIASREGVIVKDALHGVQE